MRRLFLFAALVLTTAWPVVAQRTPTVFEDPALVQRYQATITPDELAAHLYIYASDFFEGRDTGARGQRLAALYLAGQYQGMGLAPKGTVAAERPGDPRAYFQPFSLYGGTIETENVLAFVEGSDPALRDEVVVVSAHLDHVGIDPSMEGDQIHNGADDDGSGTVALLEIAEAFQQAKEAGHGPRRSVLFLHVSGEERGLLGSAYYADEEPVLPLASTVANLNIDMIGRADPTDPEAPDSNYVYIIGAELISRDIDDVNTRVNEVTGLGLDLSKRFNSPDDPNQFFARSDHWNFGKHQVPFIFYFTGTHEDYHGVDDEPDRIDYPRLAQRTRLIFGTAWQLANQDERPAVSGTGFN